MLGRSSGKVCGFKSLAAALERDPGAVLLAMLSAPKPRSPKKQVTDRSWAVFFGLPNFTGVSCVASTAEAKNKTRSGQ